MRFLRRTDYSIWIFLFAALLPAAAGAKDVPFVPTPEPVVKEMLRLAKVDAKDVLYDLGSGDGRIVVTAAKEFGTRGVGVDIDPERVADGREAAKRAGVTDKVRFIEGDLFKVDLRPATAVTLYLLPAINLRLRPKLLEELRPGTPVVSHDFDMGDWAPEQKVAVGRSTVYRWTIPARVAGKWEYRVPAGAGREEQHRLNLTQEIQKIDGNVEIDGKSFSIEDGRVNGAHVSFKVKRPLNGKEVTQKFEGNVEGGRIVDLTAVVDGQARRHASLGQPLRP